VNISSQGGKIEGNRICKNSDHLIFRLPDSESLVFLILPKLIQDL